MSRKGPSVHNLSYSGSQYQRGVSGSERERQRERDRERENQEKERGRKTQIMRCGRSIISSHASQTHDKLSKGVTGEVEPCGSEAKYAPHSPKSKQEEREAY